MATNSARRWHAKPPIFVDLIDGRILNLQGLQAVELTEVVSGRPNDTSEGRFKRYQLKTKGLLLSGGVFSSRETRSQGRNGLSTGHGQDFIYQAVTRQRDV